MVYTRERRRSRGNTIAATGGTSDRKRDKLKVAYTNVEEIPKTKEEKDLGW